MDQLEDAINKFKTYQPIPSYAPETEDAFYKQMTEDQKFVHFNELAKELEDCLDVAGTIAGDLGVEVNIFLPGAADAQLAAKELVTASAATTALRMLRSKAAENGAASLKPNLDKVLQFLTDNNVEIPQSILDRLHKLEKTLSATTARTGSKGKSRGTGD